MSSFAFAVEPTFGLQITRYRLSPPGWPVGFPPVRIAALADIHACEPWMSAARIERIAEAANELEPDLVVLLGDYVSGIRHLTSGEVPMRAWARALGRLSAPLGTHAILGNHDWWIDGPRARGTMEDHGIAVYENDAVLLRPRGGPEFWLAGLGDQLARPLGRGRFEGLDDLPGTLSRLDGSDAPAILLAHEPDIFPDVPGRFGLTLAGHTHGGQINLPFVGRPIIPSRYGGRYAYGHVMEDDRHLVISGGLGCTGVPVRFRVPPEIVLLELGGSATV